MNTTSQSQIPARGGVDSLLREVYKRSIDITAFLPADVNASRFMKLATRAILEQPGLAECSSASVMHALAACASSGLELGNGFSSLIIRKSKQGRPTATWSPSYRGMVTLALASGHVHAVTCEVVHERDHFELELGSQPRLVHRPCLQADRGQVTASYAVAEMSSGAKSIEVLTRQDIDKIRAMAPAGERGPAWNEWFGEMARKCAVRRLLKRLPASTARAPIPAASARSAPQTASGTMAVDVVAPEAVFALECDALAAMSDAATVGEIDAAWAQAQVEYQQQGVPVSLKVEARWRELREALTDSTA